MAAVLGTAALCACTEDLPEMDTSGNALQVSATVNAGTRAIVEGQLGDKQQIGVSVLATDGSDYNGKSKGYKNVLYNSALSADGKIHWTSQKPIILSPTTGTAYAYYPYSETVSDIKAIPGETASQTDYMYADPVEGLSSSNSKANFSLNHALCAVQINIKNDSYTQGPGNISRIAVSSAELATAASLNSMTGELSAFYGKGGDIENTDAFTIGKEAHATTVMAVPTGGQGELTIKVTLDGKNHRLKMPIQTPFVKGKRYVLDILAKDKTAPLEIVSVNVKPWVEESLGEYPMEVGPYGPDDYAIEVTVKDGEAFEHNVQGFEGTVDWGDGNITNHYSSNNPKHFYDKAGKYKIVATGIVQALKPSRNYNELSQITDILYIGEEIGKGITSMSRAFKDAKIAKIRQGIFNNCPNVTDFYATFLGCSSLTAIPQGLFDKNTQVTNFGGTFSGCSALTAIPQGLFNNCTNVTDFSSTFYECSALTTIPQGLFDKCTLVTDFSSTFSGCSALTAIPQGLFNNCTNVTDFSGTFSGCSALTAIPQGLFNNCTNVTDFSGTFWGCKTLTTIPQGLFDKCTKVTNFRGTFNGCSSLMTIPNGLFDNCTNVTNISQLFLATNITSIPERLFDSFGHNIKNFYYNGTYPYGDLLGVFSNCKNLKTIPAGLFDTFSNTTTFYKMFYGCSALTAIPAGLFDNCPNVTDFESTFEGCSSLIEVPTGLFKNNAQVKDVKDQSTYKFGFVKSFKGCSGVNNIPAGLFDSCTQVTSFYETFSGCSALTAIPAGLFDHCTNVTDFYSTFSRCSKITAIPQGLFDHCTNVTRFFYTFSGCFSLTAIPQGLFDKCTQVTWFNSTFSGCSSLTTIPTGLFDKCTQVTNFSETFYECEALTCESPYTLINGQKVHLYERSNYPKHFSTPTSYSKCFNNCTGLTDYNEIPANWK